jgi:UDP-N-acetylglucosamine 2-epimerase
MAAKFSLQFCSFHGFKAIVPVCFLEFLQLEANARLALTDSGGMKEEASNGLL